MKKGIRTNKTNNTNKTYYKFNDGFFTYYVNKATGEKKFTLDEGDVEVDSNLDDFSRC